MLERRYKGGVHGKECEEVLPAGCRRILVLRARLQRDRTECGMQENSDSARRDSAVDEFPEYVGARCEIG